MLVPHNSWYVRQGVLRGGRSRGSSAEGAVLHPLRRFFLHGMVVMLALGATAFAQLTIPYPVPIVQEPNPTVSDWRRNPFSLIPLWEKGYTSLAFAIPSAFYPKEPKPVGESRAPQRVSTYEVVPGDTVEGIATRFGLQTNTIVWANDLFNPDRLKVGQKLTILPLDGVLYPVASGDTLSSIAKRHKVEPEVILNYGPNGLVDPNSLTVGQQLIIPGGKKEETKLVVSPAPSAPVKGSGQFAWPTFGPIFTYFSPYHTGIDISPPYGSPIYAADAGRAVRMEKLNWGYGWYLVIDHGNGYSTSYSHVSEFLVDIGETVKRGQLIARVGNTGKTTGPHLHFEIIRNGVAVDPLGFLP